MAKYTGPDCRLCRREGCKLFLKGERCLSAKCAMEKFIKSEEIEKNFHEQIKSLNLSSNETGKYEDQVKKAVDNIMQPAYQRIVDFYKELIENREHAAS